MSSNEGKQFKKRSLPITKKYTPPYTTLRQPETEKVQPVEEPYKKFQQAEYSSLDKQIESELKELGITSEMLRQNPILRKQVTEGKREMYAGRAKTLSETIQADKEFQEQLSSVVGTDKFTFEELAEQNKKFEEAYKSGEITEKEYTQAVAQQNANILAEQKQAMKEADFTGSWDEFVKHSEKKEKDIQSAISSGIIKQDGDNITITKSPSEWTEADIKTYNELGFNVSKPTAKFTPNEITQQNEKFAEAYSTGKITEQQYQQAMYQQNLNLQAVYNKYDKEGLINKTQTKDGTTVYIMEKNLWEYTPTEQKKLKGIFNIDQKTQTTANTTHNLIQSGAIKTAGDNLVQNKPWVEMTKTDIEQMQVLGFETPNWKTVEFYKNLKKDVPGQVAAGMLTVANTVRKDLYVEDFLSGLAQWISKDMDNLHLIPDIDYIKFNDPTYLNLDEWVRVDNPEILTVGHFSLAVAEALATDTILTAGLGAAGSAIKGAVAGISAEMSASTTLGSVRTIGNLVLSKTGVTKLATYISQNAELLHNLQLTAELRHEAALLKPTVKSITSYLTKHPNITGVLISAPATGMSVLAASSQLAAGVDPHDVYMQLAHNLGFIAGGLLYNKIYTDAQRKAAQDLVRKRLIEIDAVHLPEGFSLEWTAELKDIPKEYAGMFTTKTDPTTGKVILTGFTTTKGQTFPSLMEFTASQWDDIWKSMKYGPDALKLTLQKYMTNEEYYLLLNNYPEIARMGTEDLYDILSNYKSVAYSQMSTDDVVDAIKAFQSLNRNIKPEDVVGIIQKYPELAEYVASHSDEFLKVFDDIGQVTEDEILRLLHKEIETQGPHAGIWEKYMGIDPKIVTGKIDDVFNFKIQSAYLVKDQRDIVTELYKKFASLGFSADDASKLTVNMLAVNSDDAVNILERTLLPTHGGINMTDRQIASILAIRNKAVTDPKQISHIYRSLTEFKKLSDDEALEVLKVFSKTGSPSYSIDRSMMTGMKGLSDEGLTALSEMLTTEYIGAVPAPELLNRFVTVMNPTRATDLLSALPASTIVNLNTEALTNSMISMQTEQLTATFNKLSTEQLSILVPKFDVSLLTTIVPKLDLPQLSNIIPILSLNQINDVFPTLSQEQFQNVMQLLDIPPTLIQKYLQTGHVSAFNNIPPRILKRLLDENIKRKKKEKKKKQKPSMFEVNLYYYVSSEQFKIKAKTFKDASVLALQRSKNKQVPLKIAVRQIQPQKL